VETLDMRNYNNIEKLYDIYSKSLYFTSLRIIGNNFDAQEVMQDTFIKYYNITNKDKIENPGHWLKSVCIRSSIDKLREKNREKIFLEEYANNAPETKMNESDINYSVEK
jgi:DNA-directed RNA polymerase specialized sigma subunit, sigma24 homolog